MTSKGLLSNRLLSLLSLLSCLFLISCGYRFGNSGIIDSYQTISVPYIEGDEKGVLTAILVRHLVADSSLIYRREGGELLLQVCLDEPTDDNIGFIFSRENDGSSSLVLSPNEARLTLKAKVSLIDAATCCTIMGPLYISTSVTYDFEPDLSRMNFHTFSLGQLEMHNMAEDGAFRPLYDDLSQKIVDTVLNSW